MDRQDELPVCDERADLAVSEICNAEGNPATFRIAILRLSQRISADRLAEALVAREFYRGAYGPDKTLLSKRTQHSGSQVHFEIHIKNSDIESQGSQYSIDIKVIAVGF